MSLYRFKPFVILVNVHTIGFLNSVLPCSINIIYINVYVCLRVCVCTYLHILLKKIVDFYLSHCLLSDN